MRTTTTGENNKCVGVAVFYFALYEYSFHVDKHPMKPTETTLVLYLLHDLFRYLVIEEFLYIKWSVEGGPTKLDIIYLNIVYKRTVFYLAETLNCSGHMTTPLRTSMSVYRTLNKTNNKQKFCIVNERNRSMLRLRWL